MLHFADTLDRNHCGFFWILERDGWARAYLESVGGKMPFGDKSTPEEISEMFNMSKGSFKRALGTLMKARKITQKDGWTEIV